MLVQRPVTKIKLKRGFIAVISPDQAFSVGRYDLNCAGHIVLPERNKRFVSVVICKVMTVLFFRRQFILKCLIFEVF